METPALVSGKQDNQSVSVGPSSRLDEPSCRKRKAEADTELDNKNLCKQSCNNFSHLTAGQDQSVSVEFVREYQKGKSNSTGRAPASIIVISSPSISLREPEEELEPIRERKRKAEVPEESSKKRQRVSEPEQGSSSSVSDKSEFERKYKQLELIGRGGFGSVYAGLRLEDSLPVAIKYVDMRIGQIGLSEVDGVPLEVALMQKAGGEPNAVGVFAAVTLLEWFHVDQDLVIVMERPPASMDLVEYVSWSGGRLEEDIARILMKQMVDAAIDLQNKGIFHRDLKCENTLVEMGSQEPRIRIIDFGCGTFQTTKVYKRFSGTLGFAPPEWFSCKKYRPSPTTVWQLGIILYRMLHGRHFDTRFFTRGLIKFNKNLSQECLAFLHQCLEKDSRRRATLEDLHFHSWLLPLRPVPRALLSLSPIPQGSILSLSPIPQGSILSLSPIPQGSILSLSPIPQGSILSLSPIYQGSILSLSPIYQGSILSLSPIYQGSILSLSPIYQGSILSLSPIYQGSILSLSPFPHGSTGPFYT